MLLFMVLALNLGVSNLLLKKLGRKENKEYLKEPKAYMGVGGRITFRRKMAIITCMKSNIGDHTL
jgi:hypothetical protein